jgi:hypothetical protein
MAAARASAGSDQSAWNAAKSQADESRQKQVEALLGSEYALGAHLNFNKAATGPFVGLSADWEAIGFSSTASYAYKQLYNNAVISSGTKTESYTGLISGLSAQARLGIRYLKSHFTSCLEVGLEPSGFDTSTMTHTQLTSTDSSVKYSSIVYSSPDIPFASSVSWTFGYAF